MRRGRPHNPFVRSAKGARILSASQLPFFLIRPPAGYGVLTTTGRRTGKVRRRCVRAIRRNGRAYVVAIAGAKTGGMPSWARNALANREVRLRIRGGTVAGVTREPRDQAELEQAKDAFCGTVTWFDYLTYTNWRSGRPTQARIGELLRDWFEAGTPLVVELHST